MVAIETFDRGRRLVRGQVFQPSPRYPRCLRDDPRMPRQASPVPAGSRTQAFLAFQATLRLQMNFCTQHSVATNCMLRSRSVIASIGRFSYFLYYLFSFPPYYEDAILLDIWISLPNAKNAHFDFCAESTTRDPREKPDNVSVRPVSYTHLRAHET